MSVALVVRAGTSPKVDAQVSFRNLCGWIASVIQIGQIGEDLQSRPRLYQILKSNTEET